MNHVAHRPKRSVSLTLSEDVVRQARLVTPNLSQTVEALLSDYVAAESARQAVKQEADRERRLQNTIDAAIAHYEEFGIIGAEYSPV